MGEVLEVFQLVWPAARIHVRPTPSGAAVDIRSGALCHHVMLASELAAEGAGLRLVREIFRERVPERLASARQSTTLMLAARPDAADAPSRP